METKLIRHDSKEQVIHNHNRPPAEDISSLKKCPFCAEQIQAEAIKCRYCGEFLDGPARGARSQGKKWYFTTPAVVVAMICLGPLALPLVWLNPNYKPLTRMVLSIIVLLVTFFCLYEMIMAYERIFEQIDALGM